MMLARPTLAMTAAVLDEMIASPGGFLVVRRVEGPEMTFLGMRIVNDSSRPVDEGEVLAELGPDGLHVALDDGVTRVSGSIPDTDGQPVGIEVLRIIDHRIRVVLAATPGGADIPVFDRQIRAFGPDGQALLRHLRVGVVGAGGTGSAVSEQLIRLGVGTIVAIDDDTISDDGSNVTRVWGSTMADIGMAKVDVVARTATTVGFGTNVVAIRGTINDEHVARQLRHCDVIFGCTDDNRGRVTLSRLAYRYLVPVIDMGVQIDSVDGVLRSIDGRVTVVGPGLPCLICRGRIDHDALHSELLPAEERAELTKERYAIGLPDRDPAVIAYTTGIAAFSVAELIQRLFSLDEEPGASELLVQFHFRRIGQNSGTAQHGHWCTDPNVVGAGDTEPFLGVTWTS